jgi:hypothetical protein
MAVVALAAVDEAAVGAGHELNGHVDAGSGVACCERRCGVCVAVEIQSKHLLPC